MNHHEFETARRDGYVLRTDISLSITEDLDIVVKEQPMDIEGNMTGKFYLHVIKTRDALFRDAMIFLGWTPPEKEKTLEELKASGILERKYEDRT